MSGRRRFVTTINRPWAVGAGVVLGLVLFLTTLGGTGGSVSPRTPAVNPTQPSPPVVVATLRFDGVDASTASTQSSAIPVDLGSALPVAFVWSAKGGKLGEPGLVAVASERLNVPFVGATVVTNSHTENGVVLASNGSANYAISYSSYRWVVEGVYTVLASLVAPNGTTLWSLGFFVHVEAPYHATVGNVGGVAIAAYLLATLVLGPRRRPRATSPPVQDPPPTDGTT